MIKNRHIYLIQWLLCSILTMLCSACSSSDAEEGAMEASHKQPMMAIYVYAPEQAATSQKNAAQTRADVGEVDPITNEGTIKSLQIWVYESDESTNPGNFVGYFSTNDVTALNEGHGTTYQIPVSDDFASRKPDVNVYAMANVKAENCGVGTLNKETTRDALLEGAIIVKNLTKDYFGLSNLQTSVPDDGLPFAGHLTAESVVGDSPALRIGTASSASTVQLIRAVSKLRFVFAKTTDQPTVRITSIKINDEMIPEVEYLFDKPESVTISYNIEAGELLSSPIGDIAETTDPTDYIYFNQDAQEYENLINGAGLTVKGPIYLRESDKQLTGTITYTIGGGEEKIANFAMQQAGDFSRNHTWIVYAYYAGAGKLQVQSLYVKDWSTKEMNYEYFNW